MMRHGLAPLLLTICILPAPAADPVAVRELRIQKVGDVTYFHVRFAEPRRMPPADRQDKEEQPSNAEPMHTSRNRMRTDRNRQPSRLT
jgi:hypothetical protein